MKGVNKCVIEILEPQDESIERVLVFFKPGSPAMQVGRQQEEAEKYVSSLVSWRRAPSLGWFRTARGVLALLTAAGLVLAACFLLLP